MLRTFALIAGNLMLLRNNATEIWRAQMQHLLHIKTKLDIHYLKTHLLVLLLILYFSSYIFLPGHFQPLFRAYSTTTTP